MRALLGELVWATAHKVANRKMHTPDGGAGAAFVQQMIRIKLSKRSIMAQHLCSTLEFLESSKVRTRLRQSFFDE